MTIRTALSNRNLTGERRRDAIIAAYCDEIGADYIERDEDTARAARPAPISSSEMIERLEYSMTHDTWKCNFCGTVNQSWELHCACETRDGHMGDRG